MTDEARAFEDHALVDESGRLVAASGRLLALQMAAGGTEGGEVAIPQIAALARMARSLGTPVSRALLAADGEQDVSLLASASLEGHHVRITARDWQDADAAEGIASPPEDRARAFASIEADASWSCDARLFITDIAAWVEDIAGQKLVGKRLHDVFRLGESEDGHFPLIDALAEGFPFSGQEADIRSADHIRIILHGSPATGLSGQGGGFTGGIRLVDRHAALRARPKAVADIDGGNDFSRRLNAAIRGPLGRIIEEADAIGGRMEGPLRYDYAAYASDMSAAGRHLLRLADDLSDLQAVERPDFAIRPDAIDLADIARRACGLLAVRATDQGVRIDPPATDEDLPALGDFSRTLQILVNLVSNAVRYSPPGGMVWVRAELQGDLAAIIVADQGKGIAEEQHQLIFAKFHRVDPTEPNGTGLGLFISRKLARAMGGDITVHSAPGQGARFILTLPTRPN